MASVDFKKLHGSSEVKRILRHCDKTMRINDGHRNPDIDKSLTDKNTQLPKRSYYQVSKMYDDIITAMDRLKIANKRHDRVTCFALEVPAPADIKPEKMPEWFDRVYQIISEQYDETNILQYYVHYDEIHTYHHADTGKLYTSRVHAHCLIIPEHEGKLNGKWFSSRTNMLKLNNAIHDMSLMEYGCEFMDGSKKGSVKRVEQLKRESDIKKYEMLLKERQDELAKLDESINERVKVLGGDYENFDEIWALGLRAYAKKHSGDE